MTLVSGPAAPMIAGSACAAPMRVTPAPVRTVPAGKPAGGGMGRKVPAAGMAREMPAKMASMRWIRGGHRGKRAGKKPRGGQYR